MKLITFLIGLVLAFMSLASAVDAYGVYGASSLPTPYGYRESTDFYGNFNSNIFSQDINTLFQNTGAESRNFDEQYFTSGNVGYAQNLFQNYFQNYNADVNNGYTFDKGPCVTEKIKANFRGKDNDFTIKREVCDNIQGNFYKTNSYNQNFGNSGSQNIFAFDTQAYNNQYINQYALDNDFTNKQSSTSSQDIVSVSFGKGTRIVLN